MADGSRQDEGNQPASDRRVDLSLEPPSAFVFTGEICSRAYRLNKFAFDFKYPHVRERFATAPEVLMAGYGLSDQEKSLVRARDWTGLVAIGGHHFNIIKIAAAVGESHLHVGAHMCGASWDEFKATLPHRVDLMPAEVDAARGGAAAGATRGPGRETADAAAATERGEPSIGDGEQRGAARDAERDDG
jgi:hypothetical protein